jgi:Uma2 family endonuclease
MTATPFYAGRGRNPLADEEASVGERAMTTIAQAPLKHRCFSVADFHRMGEAGILGEDERLELIEGEIIEMTPIGSPHGGRIKRLNRLLTQAVGEQAIVAVQDPVVLGEHSEPEPDLALLRPRADFYTSSHPQAADVLLLIEVADSSLASDRDIKVPLYARHGIPEVWLVAIGERRVLRFARPDQGGYQVRESIDLSRPTPLPGLPHCTLDLAPLFR